MNENNQYVSCIKLQGIPILPPMLTPIRRKEMQNYKEQAKEIEFKLTRKRIFKQCMDDIVRLEPEIHKLFESNQHEFVTLENQLTFENDVPSDDNNHSEKLKALNLTRETIDVSEYNDSGVKLLNTSVTDEETELNISDRNVSSCSIKELDLSTNTTTTTTTPKPTLVRSNSYVLDSPSPILLAHLQKENKSIKHWSSLDNNLLTNNTIPVVNDRETTNLVGDVDETIQVTETDVRIETVTVNTPIDSTKTNQLIDDLFISNKSLVGDKKIDSQLSDILKELPENYSRKILEIVEKQQIEQEIVRKSYENLKNQLLIDNNLCDNLVYDNNRLNVDKSNNISVTSSQSLYYTITNSPETVTSTPKLLQNDNTNLIKDIEIKREKERQWAASIIGAAVKGYLVRRLMKTDKVQMLIQTIKDAALCALQLESVDNIQESDIELHRRLIHQVSSACYGFYDIFFTLPINDQMQIIGKDRQKKIDKANKRPSSVTSSNTSLSKSKPKVMTS